MEQRTASVEEYIVRCRKCVVDTRHKPPTITELHVEHYEDDRSPTEPKRVKRIMFDSNYRRWTLVGPHTWLRAMTSPMFRFRVLAHAQGKKLTLAAPPLAITERLLDSWNINEVVRFMTTQSDYVSWANDPCRFLQSWIHKHSKCTRVSVMTQITPERRLKLAAECNLPMGGMFHWPQKLEEMSPELKARLGRFEGKHPPAWISDMLQRNGAFGWQITDALPVIPDTEANLLHYMKEPQWLVDKQTLHQMVLLLKHAFKSKVFQWKLIDLAMHPGATYHTVVNQWLYNTQATSRMYNWQRISYKTAGRELKVDNDCRLLVIQEAHLWSATQLWDYVIRKITPDSLISQIYLVGNSKRRLCFPRMHAELHQWRPGNLLHIHSVFEELLSFSRQHECIHLVENIPHMSSSTTAIHRVFSVTLDQYLSRGGIRLDSTWIVVKTRFQRRLLQHNRYRQIRDHVFSLEDPEDVQTLLNKPKATALVIVLSVASPTIIPQQSNNNNNMYPPSGSVGSSSSSSSWLNGSPTNSIATSLNLSQSPLVDYNNTAESLQRSMSQFPLMDRYEWECCMHLAEQWKLSRVHCIGVQSMLDEALQREDGKHQCVVHFNNSLLLHLLNNIRE